MFADDEPSLQELMKLELPRLGHRVTVCPDGLTAIAALDKNSYDCILVDLDMPGKDGIGVIAHCKEVSPETEAVVLRSIRYSEADAVLARTRELRAAGHPVWPQISPRSGFDAPVVFDGSSLSFAAMPAFTARCAGR